MCLVFRRHIVTLMTCLWVGRYLPVGKIDLWLVEVIFRRYSPLLTVSSAVAIMRLPRWITTGCSSRSDDDKTSPGESPARVSTVTSKWQNSALNIFECTSVGGCCAGVIFWLGPDSFGYGVAFWVFFEFSCCCSIWVSCEHLSSVSRIGAGFAWVVGVSDADLFESAEESGLFGSVVIVVARENRQSVVLHK